ncbi:MAG: SUMF1/EgtB/PvdO family nonheme iron enzyme [Bacteroidota bacterium]
MKRTFNFLICLLCIGQIGFSQNTKITEPELVFVKGGNFQMGCLSAKDTICLSDETPVSNVTVYDYWIGKYEITNVQYATFLSDAGNQLQNDTPWYIMDKYALIEAKKDGTFLPKKGFENHPVNNVNWYGAKAYAHWLSKKTNKRYRLPTEAEWEYAAKGGNKSNGYIFSGSDNLEAVSWTYEYATNSKVGWYDDSVGSFPVGLKKPNELGIYDMTGNLSEWVADVYDNTYKGGVNPEGPNVGAVRIVRGGSWDHGVPESRNTARTRTKPLSSFTTNKGFRVVMEKDYYSKLDTIAEKYDFNGIVLVKKRDEIVYHKSFGQANRTEKTAMTKETPFTIMSITKMFTSTIILQLMEEGKINLNNNIAHYLPNYKGPAANKVTIHQLLNHTSGIQASETIKSKDNDIPAIYAAIYSTKELMDKFCSGPLVHEPGTKFYYDNGDYIILGNIIESIENDTYENVLRKRIFQPLQMTQSGLITNENYKKLQQELRFPIGYSWDKATETLSEDAPVYTQNFFAGAGIYATITDLAKLSDGLFLKKLLLRESSLKLLLQNYPQGNEYGYGLWIRFYERGKEVIKLAHRPGRNMGINTGLTYIFDHDIAIIIFSNTDRIISDSLTAFIQKQLFEN